MRQKNDISDTTTSSLSETGLQVLIRLRSCRRDLASVCASFSGMKLKIAMQLVNFCSAPMLVATRKHFSVFSGCFKIVRDKEFHDV
jgi:hypothetical protein